ncbi:type II toxin-antitoxin system VapC family toxin [Blastococcus sp. Marseille-P5729]|uniref:type II toxin-antitoxin system VapC family toxin n=1 Tax=Blastococcus sp. Marseille-P5729 TaxID=2086582 RepID=UPI000D1055D9|nr:type II toxin-antitoxin system VapC family toxin [Blastococcus sp. Marseille-P5729]
MGAVRLLLDTHALLWALTEPDRLGREASTAIRDRSTELRVSAASAWEIATKQRLGKLPGTSALVRGYAAHLRRLGAQELAVTNEHALLAGVLTWEHRDPFDRMLAAQTIIEGLVLVTRDAVFQEVADLSTLW